MNTTQIFRVQEQRLNELSLFLNKFSSEIQRSMHDYQRQVDSMYELGLPQETYQKFQIEHIDAINNLVKQIVDHIESLSSPFIQLNSQRLQELIEINS